MRRNLMLGLLLVTGVALAEPKPEPATALTGAQEQSGAAPGQPKEVQTKKPAQENSAEAQAPVKATQRQAKPPQVKTETARGKAADAPAKATQPTAEAQTDKKKEDPQAQADKDAEPQAQTDQDGKLTSVPGGKALGMSILGNQEAPKALVIVPWKSSDVGRSMGISPMLDDSRTPVDKEVFMRELRYYEIKSQPKP